MTKKQKEYLNRVKKNILYHKNNLWKLPEEAILVEIIETLEIENVDLKREIADLKEILNEKERYIEVLRYEHIYE